MITICLRRPSPWAFTCALWCLLAYAPSSFACAGDELEQELLADAADGKLDEFGFFEAALIAGGVRQRCELAGWLADYAARREPMAAWVMAEFTRDEQRAALLGIACEQILCGAYRSCASDLRVTMAKGEYNCLSAVAVQYDLLLAIGMEATIWSTPGHVSLSPPADYRMAARELTPISLLAKFYYNRGVLALEAGRNQEGAKLLRTSLALDPIDDDARENLLAGLNNWAVAELKAGRTSAAARLVEQGLAIDENYAPLIANRRIIDRAP